MNNTKSGVDLIAAERSRQISKEGWTPKHDASHTDESIARAAACYATPQNYRSNTYCINDAPEEWPWEEKYWKPSSRDRVKELVKAGALIAAEIDRLRNA